MKQHDAYCVNASNNNPYETVYVSVKSNRFALPPLLYLVANKGALLFRVVRKPHQIPWLYGSQVELASIVRLHSHLVYRWPYVTNLGAKASNIRSAYLNKSLIL